MLWLVWQSPLPGCSAREHPQLDTPHRRNGDAGARGQVGRRPVRQLEAEGRQQRSQRQARLLQREPQARARARAAPERHERVRGDGPQAGVRARHPVRQVALRQELGRARPQRRVAVQAVDGQRDPGARGDGHTAHLHRICRAADGGGAGRVQAQRLVDDGRQQRARGAQLLLAARGRAGQRARPAPARHPARLRRGRVLHVGVRRQQVQREHERGRCGLVPRQQEREHLGHHLSGRQPRARGRVLAREQPRQERVRVDGGGCVITACLAMLCAITTIRSAAIGLVQHTLLLLPRCHQSLARVNDDLARVQGGTLVLVREPIGQQPEQRPERRHHEGEGQVAGRMVNLSLIKDSLHGLHQLPARVGHAAPQLVQRLEAREPDVGTLALSVKPHPEHARAHHIQRQVTQQGGHIDLGAHTASSSN
mmetsp:Transcript_16911/g.42334  ORF Transcript_16911/g.42334 Transcript_16911/m.42334 type:complete len:424 (+) Transcript_16911:310-1581(+)